MSKQSEHSTPRLETLYLSMARLEELLAACVCRAEVARHARLLALDELVVDPVVGRVAVTIVVEVFPLAPLVGARAGAAGPRFATVAAAVTPAVAAAITTTVATAVTAAVPTTVATAVAGAVAAARRAGARAALIAAAALLLLRLPLRTLVLRVVRVVALLLFGGSVGLQRAAAAGSVSAAGAVKAASQRSGNGAQQRPAAEASTAPQAAAGDGAGVGEGCTGKTSSSSARRDHSRQRTSSSRRSFSFLRSFLRRRSSSSLSLSSSRRPMVAQGVLEMHLLVWVDGGLVRACGAGRGASGCAHQGRGARLRARARRGI